MINYRKKLKEKLKQSPEFAKHYEKERLILEKAVKDGQITAGKAGPGPKRKKH